MENNIGIHENYLPKHKYKSSNGYQDFKKRWPDSNADVEEDNSIQCAVMFKNNEPVGILQVRSLNLRKVNQMVSESWYLLTLLVKKIKKFLESLFVVIFTS